MAATKTREKPSLEHIFAPGGWLAHHLPRYEHRPAQLAMAEEVESSLEHRRHLIAEAGTGIGKTLAYLVPAIRSGRRVVISTGTKNLQEQIFFKDLPLLKRLFPAVVVTLMKGRQNYLCRQKLYDVEKQPVFAGMEQVNQYAEIRGWERRTRTGDRAELKSLPDASGLWPLIDARRETCTGQKCAQFERCFITLLHQHAAEADLIIVNHHLFFADLALKQMEFSSLLPDYDAVVFDEAHEIEEVATLYFGIELSNYRVQELARDTEAVLRQKQIESEGVRDAVAELRRRADVFFDLFPAREGRFSFENRADFLAANRAVCSAFANAHLRLETEIGGVKDRPEELNNLARRASELRQTLDFLLETADRNYVFWWERRGRGMFLQASPIDVSALLRERLFNRLSTAVLTSATLAVGGSFDFLKRRLGLDGARERLFPSHFDYARQALLYTPLHLPDPGAEDFPRRAADEIVQILQATRGRAFVLFTSHQQMRSVYELVRPRLRYAMLVQGTAPRTALLERFRSTAHAVLFATSSFWQGVDVQGPQLSGVIIDRLPFAVPSDPVVAARVRQINENGGQAFTEYQVPEAVIALKQGLGRLIRSEDDRGVLAVLDARLARKAYGHLFLESLPGYRRTTRLEDVREFMREC